MTCGRPSTHHSNSLRRSTPWLLVLMVLFGHLYGRAHDSFEIHVECSEHPGEWTHGDQSSHDGPSHDSSHDDGDGDEHGHCSLPHLSVPTAEVIDVAPVLVELAAAPLDVAAVRPLRVLATTPLLRLAPKTSPPTTC
ncbi:MAG: hypothetical protein IPH13_17165 [Planctomycetes bacterium]|nr:hypothetical protein [Planctomycetota bacterium]MCC7173018.1 hypothetical protein [Planctomycetota bacterium]